MKKWKVFGSMLMASLMLMSFSVQALAVEQPVEPGEAIVGEGEASDPVDELPDADLDDADPEPDAQDDPAPDPSDEQPPENDEDDTKPVNKGVSELDEEDEEEEEDDEDEEEEDEEIILNDVLDYDVITPSGYEDAANENRLYPALYVMPYDGLTQSWYEENGLIDHIRALMAGGDMAEMVIVLPEFDADMNARDGMWELVEAVDAEYRTIPDYKSRAAIGAGKGGFLAYAATYLNKGATTLNTSALTNANAIFGSAAAISPDLLDADLIAKYGNVYTLMSGTSFGTTTVMPRYYTYLDAAQKEPISWPTGGTTALGAAWTGKLSTSTGAWLTRIEWNVRPGTLDAEFAKVSLQRALNGISRKMVTHRTATSTTDANYPFTGALASGSGFVTTPTVVMPDITEIEVAYTLNVADLAATLGILADEGGLSVPLSIRAELVDPSDDTHVYWASEPVNETVVVEEGAATFTGTIIAPVDRMGPDLNTNLRVVVNLLGYDSRLDSQSLVKVAEPTNDAIDLMGDWYFNYYGSNGGTSATPNSHRLNSFSNLRNGDNEWEAWDVVQPALDWWAPGFGNVTSSSAAGYAWYVREFYVNKDFADSGLYLATGKFDETDIVYINDEFVGQSGWNVTGTYGTDGGPSRGLNQGYWDLDRLYTLDPSILNYDDDNDPTNGGGVNTIYVRMYNASGSGGWYSGPVGIYSVGSYKNAAGIPNTAASEEMAEVVKSFVAEQDAYLAAGDAESFNATISPSYFSEGANKADRISGVAAWLDAENLEITDTSTMVLDMGEGVYMYYAQRQAVDKASDTVLFDGEIEQYYMVGDGAVEEYGLRSNYFVMSYRSSAMNSEREFSVGLPEGYFEPENAGRRYPVVFLFHGAGSTYKTWEIDGIQDLLREAGAEGLYRDVIVLAATGNNGFTGTNETQVVDEIIPMVDARFRTIPDARYRLAAGSSYGGFAANQLALTHPEVFAHKVGIYPYTGVKNNASVQTMMNEASKEYLEYFSHYDLSGNHDTYRLASNVTAFDRILQGKGLTDTIIRIDNGGHDTVFFKPFANEFFKFSMDSMPAEGTLAPTGISGDYDLRAEGGQIYLDMRLLVAGDSNIASVMNVIPAPPSNWASRGWQINTNPDLQVPVTVTIKNDEGAVVYTTQTLLAVSGAGTVITDTLTPEMFDLSAADVDSYTVEVRADVLDTAVSFTPQVRVESVTISGTRNVKRNKTVQLSASVAPSNATFQDVTWTSMNTSIATVDENGLVTAGNATGNVYIKATAANGKSATFLVQVTN